MKNLAGVKECDQTIIEELKTAGITQVKVEKPKNTEVPYSVEGVIETKFGTLSLTRAWTYWVVSGLVPLALAEKLYANPEGKTAVRVSGHIGCLDPKNQIVYVDRKGKELYPKTELEEYDKNSLLYQLVKKNKSIRFVDDPAKDGKPFVKNYHIDTQAGLNLFNQVVSDEPNKATA